jgi:hypothetical protein
MAARLLIDAEFKGEVDFYYETFPKEPRVKPDDEVDIKVPVDSDDKISPMSLLALLTRMSKLSGEEKELVIVAHGQPKGGLSMSLVPSSATNAASAEGTHFKMLAELCRALREIDGIKKLPLKDQPEAWSKLLGGLRQIDGNRMLPPVPTKWLIVTDKRDTPDPADVAERKQQRAVDTYEAMFEFLLDSISGQSAKWPGALVKKKEGDTDVPAPKISGWTGLNRSQLDKLLDLGNKVFGRFDRIDFRGCNVGKDTKVLEAIRSFFGLKKVCGPDVVSFHANVPVTINADFDKDFDKSVETETKRRTRGRKAVRAEQVGDTVNQVEINELADIPMTRRFDEDAARKGDEVFIRMWMTQVPHGNVHGHKMDGWIVAINQASLEQFVKDKINPDLSKWKDKSRLPHFGLWLVDDFGTAVAQQAKPVKIDTSGGFGDPSAPPPPPIPSFALPRDVEYRQHLICVP